MKRLQNPGQAQNLLRFFKTGLGQYGAGDMFWGIMVPQTRILAKKYQELSLEEVLKILQNKIHECRLAALLILVEKYQRADEKEKAAIVKMYLQNIKWINNWDLVDLSAPKIVGAYYLSRSRQKLDKLAGSKNLWERRIAVLASFPLIKQGRLIEVFKLADRFLADPHDLMHKAVGWMLREAGKANQSELEKFLWPRRLQMSRTTLRYAIERFPETLRQKYLKK
ncbi:MAG TPA: DNA alkylation repair protein [bacterium]|nr:DNA alkylation repair protein [bacterium]